MRERLASLFHVTPGQPAYVAGLRAAVGVVLPLVAGQIAGSLVVGLFASLGALNTIMADSGGPYRTRFVAMAAAGAGGALGLLVGTLAGASPWLAVPGMFAWSLVAGLIAIYGNAAAVVGIVLNVSFVLGSGTGGSPADAVQRAVAFLLGAAFVMLYSLVLWPIHPYKPVADAVAGVYRALATFLERAGATSTAADGRQGAASLSAGAWPPGSGTPTAPSAAPLEEAGVERAAVGAALIAARQAVGALRAAASGASPTDTSFLVLLRAATRLSLDVVAYGKAVGLAAPAEGFAALAPWFAAATAALADAARAVADTIATARGTPDLTPVDQALAALRAALHDTATARAGDAAAYHGVALSYGAYEPLTSAADHLRNAADVAVRLGQGRPPPTTVLASGAPVESRPSWWDTLTAQLTMQSLAFRHALRLAVAAAAGVLLYSLLGLPHGLWVTLTIVAILKPSYGSTLDMTLQRVGGTALGAILGAVLLTAVPNLVGLLLPIGLLTFVCFSVRPLSYVLFVTLLTPLVVLILELAGPSDWTIAAVRVINTVLGGLIAVLASYLLWPAWERGRLPEQLGRTIRANRAYFLAVAAPYLGQPRDPPGTVAARRQATLENANSAAAFQRLVVEPKRRQGDTRPWHELVTYNQQLLDSITSLDVHAARYSGHHTLPGLDTFVQATADALEALASACADETKPGPLPPFDAALRQIRDHVAALEATRTAELAAQATDTPTIEAVHDFSRLSSELDQIARELTGMKLALEGV